MFLWYQQFQCQFGEFKLHLQMSGWKEMSFWRKGGVN